MTTSVAPEVSRVRLIEWVQRFIRYPSEWSERMEAAPAVVAFIRECGGSLLDELGFESRYDPMGNLIVELGRRDAERNLMFATYAMTHPASTMENPFAGELVERNGSQAIRGRGVSEQKAGIAAALAAVHARHARGEIDGALSFILCTAGETGRHDAMASVLDHMDRPPALAVIPVGSSRQVALGNKGRYDIHVKIKGRAGHSSMPWASVDAIAGAAKVLKGFAALDLGAEEHPELGKPTLTATSIESFPKASHTVQGEVRMTFDLRVLPGQDPNDAYARVAETLDLPEPWEAEIDKGALQYPCEVSRDSDLISHILAGHAAAGLAEPAFFYSHAALDAGYFTAKGCEATMWGPGEIEMFHTNEESVLVDDVWDIANAYLGMIESYLG